MDLLHLQKVPTWLLRNLDAVVAGSILQSFSRTLSTQLGTL
jgi:hypothetical protein